MNAKNLRFKHLTATRPTSHN